jgi:hypothetical protein
MLTVIFLRIKPSRRNSNKLQIYTSNASNSKFQSTFEGFLNCGTGPFQYFVEVYNITTEALKEGLVKYLTTPMSVSVM